MFTNWIDTFLDEKGINLDHEFTIAGDFGDNFISVAVIVEHMKIAPKTEQQGIKNMLVKIDFANASVLDYFKHLAGALAI